jgi:hypothetical protein
MKIKINKPLLTHRGEPITTNGEEPATLGNTLELALTQCRDPELTGTGDQAYRIWKLLQKLTAAGDTVDYSVEDVALIKRVVGKAGFGIVIVGRVFDALEGEPDVSQAPKEQDSE